MMNVVSIDNKHTRSELDSPLVVSSGAGYTEFESVWNSDNNNTGACSQNIDSLFFIFDISGTMPINSEIVITPIFNYNTISTSDDITITLATATDERVLAELKANETIRKADKLKISFKFIKGGSDYTITELSSSIAKFGSLNESSAYDAISGALKVESVNLDREHVLPQVLEYTNVVDGTYNHYYDMETYSHIGFSFILDGGSGAILAKIYGARRDDGTSQESCEYTDITNDIFGSVAITSTDEVNDDLGILSLYKYIKIEVITSTGGADDADYTIISRQIRR